MLEKYDGGAWKEVYKIVTGDESWICAYEPETKQRSTVNSLNPTQIQRKLFVGKSLQSKWWPVSSAKLSMWQLFQVSSKWYTTICLPKVVGDIRKRNKRRRIIVHHDIASSHTSAQTSAFLTSQTVERTSKKNHGQRFSSPEDAIEAFQNHVFEVSQSE